MERPLDKLAGREFRVSNSQFRISSFEFRHANPNKPNAAKAFYFNNMTEKSAKQTQRTYPNCYQLLTAILGPISGKFGWMACGSLSGIRATSESGPQAKCRAKARRYRRRWEGFTSKPTMCFRMSRSEDIRPIRNSGGGAKGEVQGSGGVKGDDWAKELSCNWQSSIENRQPLGRRTRIAPVLTGFRVMIQRSCRR
jgi:hypothetical protein